MTAPSFSKHLGGNGYSFAMEELRELARLIEAEVGSPSEYDDSYRFHVRGKEWDLSCRSAEELKAESIPHTVHQVAFSLYSKKGRIELRIENNWFGEAPYSVGVGLDITGNDRDWVSGAFERLQASLAQHRTGWGWLHHPLWFLGLMLILQIIGGQVLPDLVVGAHTRGIAAAVTSGCGSLLGAGIAVTIGYLYPNVEFPGSTRRSLTAWRAGVWAIVLGLIGSAIWAVVTSLRH